MRRRAEAQRIVYLARNVVNGKAYVGATKNSLERRMVGHRASAHFAKTRFARAIAEFGFDNFEWKVLARCNSAEEMVRKEALFMRDFKSTDEVFGYNILMSQGTGLSKPEGLAISRGISFPAEDHLDIQDAADKKGRSFASEVRWRCKQMQKTSKNNRRENITGEGREFLDQMGVTS